jgi:D-serine deaminase-like pyridoxal phosphate-dependent protein
MMGKRVWYEIEEIDQIDSPALVVYKKRIISNLKKMVQITGDPKRLMPHVKTHKIKEIVQLQLEMNIRQFKCATIAEAEMLGMAGAEKVLIALQPVGPKLRRIVNLINKYPNVHYSVIVDNQEVVLELAELMMSSGIEIGVFIDLNVGMNRTGIVPGEEAKELSKLCNSLEGIDFEGFHAYDGHNSITNPEERNARCQNEFKPVNELVGFIENKIGRKLTLIAGGTPTFPIHARNMDTICSPGTTVLWDYNSEERFPDLPFEYAALVITRIISKTGKNLLCLDLGHKAIAAENPLPRVKFLNHPEVVPVSQSEEHLVAEVPDNSKFQVGYVLYGVPKHICPTCALYQEAVVVDDNQWIGNWKVLARDRFLTV